jgi:ubiquinone/menaquinone biosynthesis C-methylase UbiE
MAAEKKPRALCGEPGHVCSFRHAWVLDNFLRRWVHDPAKMFGPYVGPGMSVLDVGCGPGFASVGLARLVGTGGRVTSVDLQPEMLGILERRAGKAGVLDRIQTVLCGADDLGVAGPFGFAVAFFVVHEMPDAGRFFRQVHGVLQDGGVLFVAEPKFHVGRRAMEETESIAAGAGFALESRPKIFLSRTTVFRKQGS